MYYTEGQNNELNVTAPATIVTINGLAEEKNYSVTVSATNSAGKSASSNFMTVQTSKHIMCSSICIYLMISSGFNLEIFVWGGMVSPRTTHGEYLVTCICTCQ